MAAVNRKRIALGAVAGGVAWTVWTMIVNVGILGPRYEVAQKAGQLLKEPRYAFFLPAWIVTIFLVSCVVTWLYASVRATLGPGPRTALLLGLSVGFAAAFPLNLSTATWAPFDRAFPLWWMLDVWVGIILAVMVGGWLYKEE